MRFWVRGCGPATSPVSESGIATGPVVRNSTSRAVIRTARKIPGFPKLRPGQTVSGPVEEAEVEFVSRDPWKDDAADRELSRPNTGADQGGGEDQDNRDQNGCRFGEPASRCMRMPQRARNGVRYEPDDDREGHRHKDTGADPQRRNDKGRDDERGIRPCTAGA